MKPAFFKYHAPDTLEEALALLTEHGYDAKVLAGGQSLVPMMNFRLVQPTVIIDLNHINELFYIREDKSNGLQLHIGAMTRQRDVERHSLVLERTPLLFETMPYIAHPQIRNRGTIGGSIVHADPAAELPVVSLALNANFHVHSQNSDRWIPANKFFLGLLDIALEPEELLTEIVFPALPPHSGCAFREISRRHGDYALVGVAAVVTLDDDGKCLDAHIILLSVGDGPVQAHQAAQILIGQKPATDVIREAAEITATKDIEPRSDIHASTAYRRQLANVLTKQALTLAFERAGKE